MKKYKLSTDVNTIKNDLLNNIDNYKNQELVEGSWLIIKHINDNAIKINKIYITWIQLEENVKKVIDNNSFNQIPYTVIQALILFLYQIPSTIRIPKIPKAAKFQTTTDIDIIKNTILSNKIAYRHGYVDGVGEKTIRTSLYAKNKKPETVFIKWDDIEEKLDQINNNHLGLIDLDNSIPSSIVRTLFIDPVIYSQLEKSIFKNKKLNYDDKILTIQCIRACQHNDEPLNAKRIMIELNNRNQNYQEKIISIINILQEYSQELYYDKNKDTLISIDQNNQLIYKQLNRITITRNANNNLLNINHIHNLTYSNNKIILFNETIIKLVNKLLEERILTLQEILTYIDKIDDYYGIIIEDELGLQLSKNNNQIDYYWAKNEGLPIIKESLDKQNNAHKILLSIYTDFIKSSSKRRLIGYEIQKSYNKPCNFIIKLIDRVIVTKLNYKFVVDIIFDEQIKKQDLIGLDENLSFISSKEVRCEFMLEDVTREMFEEKIKGIYNSICYNIHIR